MPEKKGLTQRNVGRVSLMFGVLTLVSSLAGVVGGAWLAQKLRPRYATADPLVCGVGLLASAPPLFACLSFSRGPAAPPHPRGRAVAQRGRSFCVSHAPPTTPATLDSNVRTPNISETLPPVPLR